MKIARIVSVILWKILPKSDKLEEDFLIEKERGNYEKKFC